MYTKNSPLDVISFLVIFFSSLTFTSGDHERFKPLPSVIVKTRQGEKVLLPCHISDGVEYSAVKWWKNDKLVAASDSIVENGSYKLYENKTLEISQISLEDDGQYTCQVLRVEPWKPVTQIMTVQVLFPPQITTYPDSGVVDVEKGKQVILTCEVSGVPKPTIRWFHEEKEVELLYNRESLNIDKVTLQLAGLYQCIASNNIGEADSKNFVVNVIYAPEVTVDKQWIHTAPDMRAEITCNVYSNPSAKIEWYRDGTVVNLGGRIDMHVSAEKHTLVIRHVKDTDFGNYMCKASNMLGFSEQSVQLSGIPNMPIFKKSSRKLGPDGYRLVWQVDSYSNIIQYVLQFREREEDAPWKRIVIPADNSAAGPIYIQSYNLTGLQLFTQYEATILARNKFGWSRASKSYIIATEGADFSTDYNDEQKTEESNSYTITDVTGDLVNQAENEISAKFSAGMSSICCSYWVSVISSTLCILHLSHLRIT